MSQFHYPGFTVMQRPIHVCFKKPYDALEFSVSVYCIALHPVELITHQVGLMS